MPEVDDALRAEVRERAKGRCEYCLTPEMVALVRHEVDHIIAIKHGGLTLLDNLALCCTVCNKHKGSDIASIDPETVRIERLFHPRKDNWRDHFELRGAEILPRSACGRVTVRLLQLNRAEHLTERKLLLDAGLF